MDQKWKDTFLSYSQTQVFSESVGKAVKIIREADYEHHKPYVAFSGGKDSTVVFHMVRQRIPEVMVHHWDYGIYIPREFESEVIANAQKMGATNLRVETSDKYYTKPTGPVWYSEFFDRITPQYIREGFDCVFVGLRKEESLRRKRRINSNRSLTKIKEFWPIQSWSWLDVWAYIISYNLPYHSHYDRYGPVIGWDKARFTTFFDPEFDKYGGTNVDGVLSWQFRER